MLEHKSLVEKEGETFFEFINNAIEALNQEKEEEKEDEK
jgi:hypothetical protein